MIGDTVTLDVRMDRITLSVPPDPEFHGTLRLVVGGIGARSRLSYEQVNELQLAVESVVAHRRPTGQAVVVQADVDDQGVSLLVGPFQNEDDAAGLRVAERLVGSVNVVTLADGQWLELSSTNETAGATT
jgi:anti-sigma regulatory factor (Ser/Thr protein kinase)